VFEHEGRYRIRRRIATMTGAQFEIRIDGTPRTYRDRKDFAMEAASFLKSRNPHSVVEVRDLKSGEVTALAYKAT
jgi:hypothetical protein